MVSGIGTADLTYLSATIGAHLSFTPLLVLLLPRRVEAIAGAQATQALSLLLLVGAIVASVANIAAGHLGDRYFARHGNRRALIGAGVPALALALCLFARAHTMPALLACIVAFQLALNLLFSPLGAVLADHIAAARRGVVAGIANTASPLSLGGIALVGWLFPRDTSAAFPALAAIVSLLILPLVALWPYGRATPQAPLAAPRRPKLAEGRETPRAFGRDFLLALLAHLTMQVAATLVLGYVFLILSRLATGWPPPPGGNVSRFLAILSFISLAASLFASLGLGIWSDRIGRRRLPLALCALAGCLSLILMASATGWAIFFVAYPLFNAAQCGFAALDSALVAQLVAQRRARGKLLGVMNLANTLPSVIVPGATLLLISDSSFVAAYHTMLLLLAGALALTIALIAAIATVR